MPSASGDALPRGRRVVLALTAGLAAAALFAFTPSFHKGVPQSQLRGGDFYQVWYMVRALASGLDPYRAGCAPIPPCADGRQYYPLTAGLAVWPLGLLSAGAAGAVFVGVSSALLVYAITKEGSSRVAVLLSWPFVVAATGGQWTPLLVAASLIPGAEWLYAAKPHLGLALFTSRPTRRAVILVAAFGLASLVVSPVWPVEWLHTVAKSPYVRTPLRWVWFAPVLLLAAFRWRTAEGRLLLALAILPQTPYCYDQVLLWLVPRTKREVAILTGLSWAMLAAWLTFTFDWHTGTIYLRSFAPYLILFLYVPCLIMVLRRPNEGSRDRSTPSPGATI